MTLPSDRYSGPEQYDTEGNFARVMELWHAHPFKTEDASNQHNNALMVEILKPHGIPSRQFWQAVGDMLYGLYHYEGLYEPSPPLAAESDIRRKEELYAAHQERITYADGIVREFFQRFFKHVPPEIAYSEPSDPAVALIDLSSNPGDLLTDFITTFAHDVFPKTADDLLKNLSRASGLDYRNLPDKPKFKYPEDNSTPDTYLRGTPFKNILNIAVPFKIPERIRYEHTHILAGSGGGKTTLMTQQFLADVFDERQPAIIIIDGKGTWAPALQRFKCFAPDRVQSQRLIVINPQDTTPPALNMFKVPNGMENSVAEQLAYVFGSRDFELSAKQRTAFTYAARLIFSMENPTIDTLLRLMQDAVAKSGGVPETSFFFEAINRQPPVNRRFFHELFYHPTEFGETKRQIQNRIYDLLSCTAFAAMFTPQENTLDISDVMQQGKILIVDASPGAVGELAASTFGRYIIAMALSAARSRINMPRAQWRPAYLYIDEAQIFVDEERTQPLLQQAREFNLGVILAHQKLMDLTPALRATFSGNTSSKYVAYPSPEDARDMARSMHTEPEFLLAQRKTRTHTNFATYIRGLTPRALSMQIELGTLDTTPKMTDTEYAALIARNRATMSPPRTTPERPVHPVTPATQPSKTQPDASKDSW